MPLQNALDTSKAEIRLLCPGSEADTWSLEVVSLDVNPVFTALSYVWGDPSVRGLVDIDGIEVEVTVSLAEALRHVSRHWREAFPSRDIGELRLWADAVCINQDDLVERSHQVGLMRRVFFAAELVISWLGPKDEQMDLAVGAIRDMSRAIEVETAKSSGDSNLGLEWMQQNPAWCVSDLVDPDSPSPALSQDHGYESSSVWNAVAAFFELKYWERAWIFQEVVLSARLVLVLGTASLPWEVFERFFAFFTNATAPVQTIASDVGPRFLSRSAWLAISGATTVKWPRLRLLVSVKEDGWRGGASTQSDLWMHREGRWLIGFHSLTVLRAGDARDLVYGVLGVTGLAIEADYSPELPAKTVHAKFLAQFLLQRREDSELGIRAARVGYELAFLLLAGRGLPKALSLSASLSASPSDAQAPSWLPDFVRMESSDSILGEVGLAIRFEKGWLRSTEFARIDAQSSILWACALSIDRIEHVSELVLDMYESGSINHFCRLFLQKHVDNSRNSSQDGKTPLALLVKAFLGILGSLPDADLFECTIQWILFAIQMRAIESQQRGVDVAGTATIYLSEACDALGLQSSSTTAFLESLYRALFGVVEGAPDAGKILRLLADGGSVGCWRADQVADWEASADPDSPPADSMKDKIVDLAAEPSGLFQWLHFGARVKAEFGVRHLGIKAGKMRVAELRHRGLALVHPGVLAGDEVFLFRGCPAPLVLRTDAGQDYFALIGSCYIAGWDHDTERAAADRRAQAVQRIGLR
jgi:hypothetical protein